MTNREIESLRKATISLNSDWLNIDAYEGASAEYNEILDKINRLVDEAIEAEKQRRIANAKAQGETA